METSVFRPKELLTSVFVISITVLFHQTFGCQDSPVGVAESSIIPDDRFTATSYYDNRYVPKNARLNGAAIGWGPKTTTDSTDYLQVDLGEVFVICAVATQGNNVRAAEWTKQYKISTSIDNNIWTTYKDGSTDKLFTGNTDRNTVVKNVLDVPTLTRYIRFIPTNQGATSYHNWKILRVEAYGLKRALLCRSVPVGIGNGKIPDSSMTSSTTYNSTTSPSKARLGYTAGSSWCAATSDSSPYLQINLGSPYIICGVATQGDHMTDQWIQSYQMTVSTDGTTFNKYMENSQVKSFNGNFDSNTVVNNVLYDGTIGQYIRVTPTSHYGTTNCMRTELYGIQQNGGCTSMAVGLSYSSAIQDHRFTASSYYDERYRTNFGRLITSNKAWGPKTVSGAWLQIDLGSVVHVCAVATQGGGVLTNERVTRYKIKVSLDNVNWNYYQENNIDKEFTGNSDRYAVVTNKLANPTKAKFIRFYPTDYSAWPAMRTEVYGIPSACSSPIGLEKGGIAQNIRMTSSSDFNSTHTASHGRLYGNSSWCSNTSSNTEYIHINLGQVMTVSGIATQGDHTMDKWVKNYTISYSMDGNLWNTYKDGMNSNKVLQGNSDRSSIVVRWLSHPLTARHVRVTPQTWNTAICMRMELYGCNYATRPVISGLTNQNLTAAANSYVDLVCIVQESLIQYIKWYTGNTDITSQSTGLVSGVSGVKTSTLRINYTTANDVLNNYRCIRSASSAKWLCSKPYVCKAMYEVNSTDADGVKSAGMAVRLDYPSTIATPTVDNIQSTSVTVKWTQPVLRPSQAAITSYVLQYQNSSYTQTINVSPPALSQEIAGLAIYTSYSVKIRAVSRVGHGQWSQTRNFTTDSALPVVSPASVTANALTSQSIRVTWQTPTSGVNGPLRGYRLSYAPVSGSIKHININAVQTSYDITSLEKWTVYRIIVKCYNDKGYGPSAEVVVRTLEDAPSNAPGLFSVTVLSSTSVQLSWSLPPINSRNGIIRGFEVYYKKTGSSESAITKDLPGNSTLVHTITGLGKYTTYTFKVLAYTKPNMKGPYSNEIEKTTEQDAPSVPRRLQTTVIAPTQSKGPHIILTWDIPEFPNGILRTYIVSYSHREAGSIVIKTNVDGGRRTVTLPVLGGVEYWFRVKAVTIKEGNDTLKKQIFIPIYKPIGSPKSLSVFKIDSSNFIVSWKPIPRDKANGPIIKYQITWTIVNKNDPVSKSIVNTKMVNSSVFQVHLDNLVACSRYNISVGGYTSAGPGPFCEPITLMTSAPGAPQHLSVAATGKREVTLQWTKPSVTESIEKYTITLLGTKLYNNSFLHSNERVSTSPIEKFQVDHLYPDTNYKFQVSASTRCGNGAKSIYVKANTKVDAPPAPLVTSPPVNITSSSTLIPLWPASDINGQIRSYQVIVKEIVSTPPFDVKRLTDYTKAKQNKLHYYIAAEIDAAPFHQEFILGDGKLYGEFENVKLDEKKLYEVAERALTHDNEKYLPGPMSVVARHMGQQAKNISKNDNIVHVVCESNNLSLYVALALLAIAILIIILLLVYIWRIKRELRNTNTTERYSPSRSKTRNNESEPNTIALEERSCQNRARHRDLPRVPIISEDVYAQIEDQNFPDSTPSASPPQSANIKSEAENKASSTNQNNNPKTQTLPSSDGVKYDKPAEQLRKDEGVDTLHATTPETETGGSSYEVMAGSTKHTEKSKEKTKQVDEPGLYAHNIPKNQNKYEPLLFVAPETEYKSLHNYTNAGFKDQSQA